MTEIMEYTEKNFESIKHINEYGEEYWLARELQLVLEYTQWRRFSELIERAKAACANSGIDVEDHFADIGKMVDIGSERPFKSSAARCRRIFPHLLKAFSRSSAR